MAEGGYDYTQPLITHDNYDDYYDPNTYNDDAAQQALSTTQPFEPGQASTPYHRGEQVEMQTMQSEQAGLPSYAETSFGGDEKRRPKLREDPTTGIHVPNLEDASFIKEVQNKQKERAKRFIKRRYPHFNEKKLVIGFSKKNPLVLVSKGPRGGENEMFLKDGSDFQESFLNKTYVKNAIGKPAESLIKQTSDDIRKMQKERDKLRQDQARYFEEKEAKEKEELDLKRRIQAEEEKRQQLQDNPSADKKVLEQKEGLIKNLKKDLKTKQKENVQLQKNYEDSQKKTKKIGQLQESILQEEQKRDSLERNFNSTRSFDMLKEEENNLLRLNEEDQAIINDEDAVELDKEAAEERIAARNEELARLQTQIAEREDAMPLREKIKEIFKKHGVTVTSIVIAAGITIGAVVSALTKGLIATRKAMAGGLKEIGAKLGSLLPGLIGQVAHFLFNTAAKAVGFLAEHTWLIILAVVAFVFEKYIKKRR